MRTNNLCAVTAKQGRSSWRGAVLASALLAALALGGCSSTPIPAPANEAAAPPAQCQGGPDCLTAPGSENGPAPVIPHQGQRIGARLAPVPPGAAAQLKLESDTGMLVVDVAPNAPAAAAGLRKGDVVLSVDNAPVSTMNGFSDALNAAAPNHVAKLEVSRNGKKRQTTLTF